MMTDEEEEEMGVDVDQEVEKPLYQKSASTNKTPRKNYYKPHGDSGSSLTKKACELESDSEPE